MANQQKVTRKLRAIFSADVKGYSILMADDEVSTIQTLKKFRGMMSARIEQHQGRVVDAVGDNLLAEFGSAFDAVKCAAEVQKELKVKNQELPEDKRLEFRIGINIGDVIQDGGRLFGDGVNVAARIEGLADAGGICISGSTYDQIKNKLKLSYDYLGEHKVKNIKEPVRVYKVLLESGAPAPLVDEPLELPDKPSIAVLPFDNLSGDPKQEYFSDGITDQIITSLSIIPRLFVIARNSTFTYKGKAIKVQKVAEELGVQYVVEGSVQRSEGRIRILVQLIDATTGRHLWSERYDRHLKDLFELQDEIALKIMTALQVKLTEGEYASGIAGSTSNLKALEFFWRAEEHFFRTEKEDNAAARQWAEKAIEIDPNFAGALALLGFTHIWDVYLAWGNSPVQSMKQSEEYAQKALSINDSTAKAHFLMSFIRRLQGKYDEALVYGEKAVALNPNDPAMIVGLAGTMHYSGRFDEAIALTKKAMRLCPYYPAIYLINLASSYNLTGRYQKAIEICEHILNRSSRGEINPLYAHVLFAEAYIGLGQLDKARMQTEEVLKIDPKFSLNNQKYLTIYKDPLNKERRFTALRKAGLPK